MDDLTANWPNPHGGGRCPQSSDGGVGFYSATSLGAGMSYVECPNQCGWWRTFHDATGLIADGDHLQDALTAALPGSGTADDVR